MNTIKRNKLLREESTATKFYWVSCISMTGYFLISFINHANDILATSLREAFILTNAQTSILTGAHLLTLGLFQIPLGILLDRFKAYCVQAALLMVAFFGMIISVNTMTYHLLILSQILIGIGFSGGLITGLKIIIENAPKAQLSSYITAFIATGMIGGLCGPLTLNYLLALYSWQPIILTIAVLILIIALLTYKNRDKHYSNPQLNLADHVRNLAQILKSHAFMRLAPITSLCFGTNMAILKLGNINSTSDYDLFSTASALLIGIMTSSYIIQKLSLQNKLNLISILSGGIFVFVFFQYFFTNQILSYSFINWIFFGFTVRWLAISYAILANSFNINNLGKCLTLLNFTNISIAFFTHVFIVNSLYYLQTSLTFTENESLQIIQVILTLLELIAIAWLVSGKKFIGSTKENQ